MSEAEIKRQIDEAEAKDVARNADGGKAMPVQMLVTAIALGGRDTSGKLCPVFALRLRGPDGRRVADGLRTQMRGWDES